MKKIVYSALAGLLLSTSAFAQGFITFANGTGNGIFDDFTNIGTPTKNSTMYVGFIWEATTAGVTNTLSAFGTAGSTAGQVLNPWSSLSVSSLLSSGWQWGTNGATSAGIFTGTVSAPPPAVGDFNGGGNNLMGSSASGVISMYVIAWKRAYTNPGDAAGASPQSPIGWSAVFNYTLGTSSSPGGTLANNFASFYVNPVPEPATFALAGLGGVALLLFRRRK